MLVTEDCSEGRAVWFLFAVNTHVQHTAISAAAKTAETIFHGMVGFFFLASIVIHPFDKIYNEPEAGSAVRVYSALILRDSV